MPGGPSVPRVGARRRARARRRVLEFLDSAAPPKLAHGRPCGSCCRYARGHVAQTGSSSPPNRGTRAPASGRSVPNFGGGDDEAPIAVRSDSRFDEARSGAPAVRCRRLGEDDGCMRGRRSRRRSWPSSCAESARAGASRCHCRDGRARPDASRHRRRNRDGRSGRTFPVSSSRRRKHSRSSRTGFKSRRRRNRPFARTGAGHRARLRAGPCGPDRFRSLRAATGTSARSRIRFLDRAAPTIPSEGRHGREHGSQGTAIATAIRSEFGFIEPPFREPRGHGGDIERASAWRSVSSMAQVARSLVGPGTLSKKAPQIVAVTSEFGATSTFSGDFSRGASLAGTHPGRATRWKFSARSVQDSTCTRIQSSHAYALEPVAARDASNAGSGRPPARSCGIVRE